MKSTIAASNHAEIQSAIASGRRLSITGAPELPPPNEAGRVAKIEKELASQDAELDRARKRLPAHIRIAEPGAPRAPINLATTEPDLSRQLVVAAKNYDDGDYSLLHFGPDGSCSKDKSRVKNRPQVIDAALACIETHDIIIAHSTINGKRVGPGLSWDDLSILPNQDAELVWVVADGGPVDPGRFYVANCWSSNFNLQIFGSRALALDAAKLSFANGPRPYDFWYRHNVTVAHLPPETSGFPPWIYGERLLPDFSNREYLVSSLARITEERSRRLLKNEAFAKNAPSRSEKRAKQRGVG